MFLAALFVIAQMENTQMPISIIDKTCNTIQQWKWTIWVNFTNVMLSKRESDKKNADTIIPFMYKVQNYVKAILLKARIKVSIESEIWGRLLSCWSVLCLDWVHKCVQFAKTHCIWYMHICVCILYFNTNFAKNLYACSIHKIYVL